ncbi:hypothetical protein [Endozoicomonas sp.]|uniref:hypothetical protein n=1 Tax=Endozoicomonas sp. TaxID=1892382 RepID=UPI00383BF50F
MTDNPTVMIVSAVVVIILVATAAYYIIRFLRGSIKLLLPRTVFNPGDAIVGSFDLHTKKAIPGNQLIISLIGIEKVKRRKEDGGFETYSEEVYRDDVLLEESRVYPAGYKTTHEFEISIPGEGEEESSGPAFQALATAFSMLSQRSVTLSWKVEARLDAEGVDLATAQSVSINI